MLKLIDAKVSLADSDSEPGRRWCVLQVNFMDDQTQHQARCDVKISTEYNRAGSLHELEESVRRSAVSILAATQEALGQSLADLALGEGERKQAADAAFQSSIPPLLDGAN